MTASKVLVDNYNKGRDILLKPSCNRTCDDIDFLADWLSERSLVFMDLDKDGMKDIASCVTLGSYNPNVVVYQQEDTIEHFHVILRGSISLLIDPSFKLKQQANQAAALVVDSLLKGSNGNKAAVATRRGSTFKNRANYGKEVKRLTKGDYVGQEALCQRDPLSPFSVFTDEHVELLTIPEDVFDKLLFCRFQTKYLSKAQFITRLEPFSKCSPHILRLMSFAIEERRYQLGDCLYRQNLPLQRIYFIKKGSIKLSISSKQNPPSEVIQKIEIRKDHLSEILSEDLSKTAGKSLLKSSSTPLLSNASQVSFKSSIPLRVTSAQSRGLLKRRMKKKPKLPKEITAHFLGFKLYEPKAENTTKVCILGPGDILCEIEALCQVKHHLFNAVCMSDTVLYELDLHYFDHVLRKKAPHSVYQIATRALQRVESWKERLPSCYVPFFSPIVTVLNQVDKALESNGAHKAGRAHRSAYPPEQLSLIAIVALGKVPVEMRKAKEEDNNPEDEPDVQTDKRHSMIPMSDLADFASLLATDHTPFFSVSSLTLPSSHMMVATAAATSSKHSREAFSFDSPPPRRLLSSRKSQLASSSFAISSPIPSPISYDKESSTTTTGVVGMESSRIFQCSPLTVHVGRDLKSPNLAKIHLELLTAAASQDLGDSHPSHDNSTKENSSINNNNCYCCSATHKQTSKHLSTFITGPGLSLSNTEDVHTTLSTIESEQNKLGSQTPLSDADISPVGTHHPSPTETPMKSDHISIPQVHSSSSLSSDRETTIPDEYKTLRREKSAPSSYNHVRYDPPSSIRTRPHSQCVDRGLHMPISNVLNVKAPVTRVSPDQKRNLPLQYNYQESFPPRWIISPKNHASLVAMKKEGHLHLAKPWTGNVRPRKPSPLIQPAGPTFRRKVKPRPPVNLIPGLQKPFYA